MYNLLLFFLALDALILTTAVLLQAGQGGGLAPLGGGARTEQLMGGPPATTLVIQITARCPGVVLPATHTGCQEVQPDPSYLGPIGVRPAQLIGKHGINPGAVGAARRRVAAVVRGELSAARSSWRAPGTLAEWLGTARVP